ncbi:MAG: PASTA domain-containing protein [Candidatus Vogelbacteria bacterium]|nr:PASTA domain-containing protein [Candidatus Vogelbacteria bacterium]
MKKLTVFEKIGVSLIVFTAVYFGSGVVGAWWKGKISFNRASPTEQATPVMVPLEVQTFVREIPDFRGKSPEEVAEIMEAFGLHYGNTFLWSTNDKRGDGKVIEQTPPPGTPRTEYDEVSLVYGKSV